MNENGTIFYIVEEHNRLGQLRSRFQTTDMMEALAEWLLKTHKPIGFPPGVKPGHPPLLLEVTGNGMPLDSHYLDLEAHFNWNGDRVRSLRLKTHASTMQIDKRYDQTTVNIYLSDDYKLAVEKMRKKLKAFCLDKKPETYVAAQFAARNPSHPFWRSFMNMRARGLGM